ncbi:MAG: NAD-dependent epimerase/dehydratase family protein [Lachnospiraceae bacterium]|nr:NAD-dependent epimerase/dehydratase family protein [Lachnospiraceae bacterium]
MKILVIGGSYFLGRVFTMLASERYEVTVLNRGTYSMEAFGVKCIAADRHDEGRLEEVLQKAWDVVVDFCAYRQGDIAVLLSHFLTLPKQYVFISTADVYRKWTGKVLDENAPLDDRHFSGDNGEYIWQKILLEKELKSVCQEKEIAYTSVRPAVLYGPFNYAQREAVYVQMACMGQEIICPTGCAGRFQPVYVKDAAAMILSLCKNPKAYDTAYNLAAEAVDYEKFLEAFVKASGGRAKLRRAGQGDPCLASPETFLPFALTEEETEIYSGEKIVRDTGLLWTPLESGLQKTWNVFSKLYQPEQ